MWIELNDDEVFQMINAIGDHPIRAKLVQKEHPDSDRFRNAADFDSDYVTLPIAAPVIRTRNGAYVMAWYWVYNQTAGFKELADFYDFDFSSEIRDRFEEVHDFEIDWLDLSDADQIAEGAIGDFPWEVAVKDGRLQFSLSHLTSPEQAPAWKYLGDRHISLQLDDVNRDDVGLFILEAVETFRAEKHPWMKG